MEGAGYQKLVGDVMFWHSVLLDERGYAVKVQDKPVTMDDIRGPSRRVRVCDARKDICKMLRHRETMRGSAIQVFSLTRIGAIIGRHYSTVLNYLRMPNQSEETYGRYVIERAGKRRQDRNRRDP